MAREFMSEEQRSTDDVASLAVTLDGFVCRPDGAVDYLDKYPLEGFDFAVWADRIGALVMGRTGAATSSPLHSPVESSTRSISR